MDKVSEKVLCELKDYCFEKGSAYNSKREFEMAVSGSYKDGLLFGINLLNTHVNVVTTNCVGSLRLEINETLDWYEKAIRAGKYAESDRTEISKGDWLWGLSDLFTTFGKVFSEFTLAFKTYGDFKGPLRHWIVYNANNLPTTNRNPKIKFFEDAIYDGEYELECKRLSYQDVSIVVYKNRYGFLHKKTSIEWGKYRLSNGLLLGEKYTDQIKIFFLPTY